MECIFLQSIKKASLMSFKQFSTTHNDPAKPKAVSDLKPAPVFDHPPVAPTKTPEKKSTGQKA